MLIRSVLFNFQGAFLNSVVPISQTTLLLYHIFSSLSRGFSKFSVLPTDLKRAQHFATPNRVIWGGQEHTLTGLIPCSVILHLVLLAIHDLDRHLIYSAVAVCTRQYKRGGDSQPRTYISIQYRVIACALFPGNPLSNPLPPRIV